MVDLPEMTMILLFTFVVVDGGWGDWTEYGECTETCGVGKQLKSRQCNNPTPQNGGADCTGISEDHQECNQEPCLGNYLHKVLIVSTSNCMLCKL